MGNRVLLWGGRWMLRSAQTRWALVLAEAVRRRCEREAAFRGTLPKTLEEDYGLALLLEARALAQTHSPIAPMAYLRARQWTPLEPEDVEFVAGYYLNHIPKSFSVFPVYVDWFHQSRDPVEAELRIRNVAEIKPTETPDEPTLPIREDLNAYLFAHFPDWLWTLEHLANAHIIREEWERAHGYLAEWLARDPENGDVLSRERLVAAYEYLCRDQLPEALSALETAMLSGGGGAPLAARQLLTLIKRVSLARAQMRKLRRSLEAFSRESDDPAWLTDYAKWTMSSDENIALSALYRALEKDAFYPHALWELAHVLYRKGSLSEALELLNRFLQVRPEEPNALHWASRMAEELGRFEQVVAFLERIPQRSASENLRLAKAYLELHQPERTEDILDTLDETPLSEEECRLAQRLRADTLFEKGERESALERYRMLLEVYRDDWRLYDRLARAYLSGGRWAEARKAYGALLAIRPTYVSALNGRGMAAYCLGDLRAAAEDFHESLLLELQQPMTIYALGLCLMDSDPETAQTLFAHAVEKNPELEGGWLGLARFAEKASRWTDAADAYERALKIRDDSLVRMRLAYVAFRAEQFERARDLLANTFVESKAQRHYLFGFCCFRLGALEEAAQHWRLALLERRDPLLEEDLAWLYVRLADQAAVMRRRAEMTQYWNIALERFHHPRMTAALVPRWAHEALWRLRQPTARDVQIAHDLMRDVLTYEERNPLYRILAAVCAGRLGDWPLGAELVESLREDPQWGAMAMYLFAVCQYERNLPDGALATLDLHSRDWGEWESEVQAFRVQIYLDAGDVERTARELAMLRVSSKERCPHDVAIAVLLRLRLWRHVYDLVMELAPEERSDLAHYAAGVAALMLRRETEGIERLEQVPADSEWNDAARSLRLTGIKRKALRSFHSLGWNEVAASLEEVLLLDEEDEVVREWLDRARVFAALSEPNENTEETLTTYWKQRLQKRPNDFLPLHQWAVYAYWKAQRSLTPEAWREAAGLWGSLLSQEDYWVRWTTARLARHEPEEWRRIDIRERAASLRRRLVEQFLNDMTDALLRADPQSDVDESVLSFLREYQTATLWRDWLDQNPSFVGTVFPLGGVLLERLGRLEEARSLLSAREKIQPTVPGERLLLYLSSWGELLAAAETGNISYVQRRTQELFNSPDPLERQTARLIFVVATRNTDPERISPREGLESVLTAMLAAKEVFHSLLVSEMDWSSLLTRLSDRLVADVEALSNRPPEGRLAEAASALELLKRLYEATHLSALIHAIVRVTLFEARAHVALGKRGRRAVDDPYFVPQDAEALNLLQEALALAPEHVTLQQETAQLRLRRGLVAAQEGRLNEALIDLARAHELDPVSHRITTAYARFMMEQATKMWMENRADAQREALVFAHRALQADPTDAYLLSRCARFLDLPSAHPLRETPEYQRLLTLFYSADDGS